MRTPEEIREAAETLKWAATQGLKQTNFYNLGRLYSALAWALNEGDEMGDPLEQLLKDFREIRAQKVQLNK